MEKERMTCFLLRFLKKWIHFSSNPANHLVKSFVANAALECLLTRMGQSVVFVVAFLMESFPTKFANPRLVSHMNSHMSVECRAAVKSLAASTTFMWLLRCMNDLVPT